MTARTATRLAWSLWALATAFILGGLISLLSRPSTETVLDVAPILLAQIGFPTLGALLASRRRENPIGWMFLAGSVFIGLGVATGEYADRAVSLGPLPATVWVLWINTWSWFVGLGLLLGFTPFLFPNGRLPSRRWRPLVWVAVGVFAFVIAAQAFRPGLVEGYRPYRNPLGIESAGGLIDAVLSIGYVVLGIVLVAGVVSLFVRMRKAGGEERRQIKWFVYAAGISVAGIAVGIVGGVLGVEALEGAWVVGLIGLATMPIAAAIGILKYRLYDIDVVISKTVVYGVLAAFVTAVYLGIVVGVGALIGSRGNVLLSIVATALIAAAFQPVRQRARHLANRLVYGKRASPYEVLSEFSGRVAGSYAPDDALPRMARVVGEGTGARGAGVWLRVGRELRREASWPSGDGSAALEVQGDDLPDIEGADRAYPVRDQGELLGALSISKPPGEPLTPAEDKLLGDLASQARLILRNVGLIEELRASRQRLVTAQDEERRRLERNIHDGAQQQLVALAVKIRLARTLAGKDTARAEALLDDLQGETQEALENLRDLARGIYPPLLADQGLTAALQAQARKVPFPVDVQPDGVGRYPAEAEATAYFCVLEALQNAAKYADASRAVVRLAEEDGRLLFSVQDDGRGFDSATTPRGSGLQNMADRLEAVGGSVEVRSAPGRGTTVTGRIPVSAA
ncbi:MAG: histidine kinase [Actinomycetota bacterium]